MVRKQADGVGLQGAVRLVATLNLAYFGIEFAVALAIGSASLFADSIDFLEDAAVSFLILVALGWGATWRARVGSEAGLHGGAGGTPHRPSVRSVRRPRGLELVAQATRLHQRDGHEAVGKGERALNELTYGTVCAADAATGAEIGPYRDPGLGEPKGEGSMRQTISLVASVVILAALAACNQGGGGVTSPSFDLTGNYVGTEHITLGGRITNVPIQLNLTQTGFAVSGGYTNGAGDAGSFDATISLSGTQLTIQTISSRGAGTCIGSGLVTNSSLAITATIDCSDGSSGTLMVNRQ